MEIQRKTALTEQTLVDSLLYLILPFYNFKQILGKKYLTKKLSNTQMSQYLIPLRTASHEFPIFLSNKLLAVFYIGGNTAQKTKFSIKDIFIICNC